MKTITIMSLVRMLIVLLILNFTRMFIFIAKHVHPKPVEDQEPVEFQTFTIDVLKLDQEQLIAPKKPKQPGYIKLKVNAMKAGMMRLIARLNRKKAPAAAPS